MTTNYLYAVYLPQCQTYRMVSTYKYFRIGDIHVKDKQTGLTVQGADVEECISKLDDMIFDKEKSGLPTM